MATDYTFIFGSIQELKSAQTRTFAFRTPNVDTSEGAVLMFHARAVLRESTLQINGQNVGNGVPKSPSQDDWTGHVLLVNSAILTENGDNVLEIKPNFSRRFFIDNCVIFYKTP